METPMLQAGDGFLRRQPGTVEEEEQGNGDLARKPKRLEGLARRRQRRRDEGGGDKRKDEWVGPESHDQSLGLAAGGRLYGGSMAKQIAIIGAGVMGETLLAAVLKAGHGTDNVVITEKRQERADELREKYGVKVVGNAEAAAGAEILLLVVKPQDMAAVLTEIGTSVRPGTTVMSLAAGIRIEAVEAALADGVAVIRAMPNTPALVDEGMFGLSPGKACTEADLAAAQALLESSGKVVILDEKHQDALTGVSGSGPAYVFYLAEAMIAGGVAAGLDEETAKTLTIQTIVGSAKLLDGSPDGPEVLRQRVTSPNGTTAAAIATFDERGVKESVAAGVVAAAHRSAELSQ